MPILKEKPHWRNTLHTFMVWILRKIFPPYHDFEKAISSKIILPKQGKALFIRIDQRLGNLLLTTPTIKNLKELFPEFSIDVLTASKFQSVLSQLPFIHQVIPFQKKMFFRNLLSFFFGILELRKKEYDIVFDCSHSHIYSSTGSILTFIIGRKFRVGHFHEQAKNLYTHSVFSLSESNAQAQPRP